MTKIIKNKGFPYKVYSVLYDSCVSSITDYGSEVLGFGHCSAKLNIQLRAIRAFLGPPKTAGNASALSEFDWLQPHYRGQLRMVRFLNRVLKMSNDRLTKNVYIWDKHLNDVGLVKTWSSELRTVLESCDMPQLIDRDIPFCVKTATKKIEKIMSKQQNIDLKNQCWEKPKLRTFVKFKIFGELPILFKGGLWHS